MASSLTTPKTHRNIEKISDLNELNYELMIGESYFQILKFNDIEKLHLLADDQIEECGEQLNSTNSSLFSDGVEGSIFNKIFFVS